MIVKALVSYDGFNYAGWQKQENALGIQQVIEEALYKITKGNVDVVASGRTDAGVHAIGQVFHFETSKNIPTTCTCDFNDGMGQHRTGCERNESWCL